METPPQNILGKKFPIGDISWGETMSRGIQWLDRIESLEYTSDKRKYLLEKLSLNHEWLDSENISPDAHATFGEAGRTCANWNPEDEKVASVAFWVAHCFGAQTNIVPTSYAYFVEELSVIQDMGPGYAAYFGKTVWKCMEQSHPTLHMLYKRLDDILTSVYGLEPGQENTQKAGIGLAYLLATQTAMLQMSQQELTVDGM